MREMPGNALTYTAADTIHHKDIDRIPESHTLHVGPGACARRHFLKALENDDAQNMSMLNIDQSDLISGGYEDAVIEAVRTIVDNVTPTPRIIIICFTCIDDLLGTDEDNLLRTLRAEFPAQKFLINHVRPIRLNEDISPGAKLHASPFTLLDDIEPKDGGVNLLCTFASFDPACEINTVLADWGFGPFRMLHRCKTYDEFARMGASSLGFYFNPMGKYAAEVWQQRCGGILVPAFTTFNPDRVAAFYRALAQAVERDAALDLEALTARSHEALRATASKLGTRPVIIDSSATMFPFDLGRCLLEHGFAVTDIFAKSIEAYEEDDRAFILAHGTTAIHRAHNYTQLAEQSYDPDSLVLGLNFARTAGLRYAVDLWHDEGYFGFQGIAKLLRGIDETRKEPR